MSLNIPSPYEIDKFMIDLLHFTPTKISAAEKLYKLDTFLEGIIIPESEPSK
jgi:hypothetical protein